MALGTFKANSGNFPKATPFDADEHLNEPLIVVVRDFKEDFSTQQYPNPRPVAFVQIAALGPVLQGQAATLFANAILGGDAVADRLRAYAGAETEDGEPVKLPVKLGMKRSEKTGRKYRTIEPLTGPELELAGTWDEKNPTALADEYARLQAEADAEAEKEAPKAASNGNGGKFNDDALAAAIAGLKG